MKKSVKPFIAMSLMTGALFAYGCGKVGADRPVATVPDVAEPKDAVVQKVFGAAMQMGDVKYCEALTAPTDVADCKRLVEDSNTLNKAVAQGSIEVCGKVYQVSMRKLCETRVKDRLDLEKQKQNSLAISNKEELTKAAAIKSNDVEACKQITTPDIRETCMNNVITSLALQKQDKAMCKELTPGVRELCEQVIR